MLPLRSSCTTARRLPPMPAKLLRFTFLLGLIFVFSFLYVRNDSNSVGGSVHQVCPEGSENLLWETNRLSPPKSSFGRVATNNRHCARLKVPLDYASPVASSAAIAMVRHHSAVPHNSSRYRGPILINPGGPGGSGVDIVVRAGARLATIVGPEFDIIGFDPRGIGRSTPRVSSFETRVERKIWEAKDPRKRSLNSSDGALWRVYARALIDGQLAGERDDGSLRYINTDHTARDMLRIVQAHGRDKLQYWGFSYGSILGVTFASMFPDNVERLIIDGVGDAESYFATEWSYNIMDTEKTWESFVDGCVAAGPDTCAFYAPTADALMEKVNRIYDSIRLRPIPVRTNTSYGLVDYSLLRNVIFDSLFSPYATFVPLARALADLNEGNGTALFSMAETPSFKCECDSLEYSFDLNPEAETAVLCNDGKQIPSTYEDAEKHYLEMSKTSSWADVWASIPMGSWPKFPKNHFQGPFVANTSFPLLIIGNTADPAAPLWAARKMAKGFAGSIVLTQDSAGHCSISVPSLCTQKYIRQYFFEGVLPDPDTVCSVIGTPFDVDELKAAADTQIVLGLSADDHNLLDVLQDLARTYSVRGLRGRVF
ncbi:Alpha/Beta hydrolase protein, partial [Mycena rebaudengoi]